MVLSAVGIIMVVDAHCWGALNLFTSFFPYNSFFMPMFAFISGYFNNVNQNTDLWKYTKRKFKTLLIPYFIISIVAVLIEWIINLIKCDPLPSFSVKQLLLSFLNTFTTGEITDIAAPLWFVPMLFSVQIVYALLKKALFRKWNSTLFAFVFTIVNVYVVWYAKGYGVARWQLLLLKVLFFLPFIEFGILYRNVFEDKLKKINPFLILSLLLILNMVRMMLMPSAYDIAFNSLSTLSGFTSPYVITPMISSIAGILFWLEITDLIGPVFYENRIINYISDNTFFIMGFHIIFFNILNCILLAVNKISPLPDFDIPDFQASSWYRWEHFTQFRLAYFFIGLFGSLAAKQIYDRCIERVNRRDYMGLYIMDSDGDFFVEGKRIIHDNRGHREIYKRFSSEAEAEAYMRRLIDKWAPPVESKPKKVDGKHKKSHRPKHTK